MDKVNEIISRMRMGVDYGNMATIKTLLAEITRLREALDGVQYVYNSYQLGDFTEVQTIEHMAKLARDANPLPKPPADADAAVDRVRGAERM